jgi:hypothetical protein
MRTIDQFQVFITYLEKQSITKEPKNLYEPIAYMLGLGDASDPFVLMTAGVLSYIRYSSCSISG